MTDNNEYGLLVSHLSIKPMKIIEAMRNIKVLNAKAGDLVNKIRDNSADHDNAEPKYGSVEAQKAKIEEWLQSHKDTIREIERLRLGIQRTNLLTECSINIGTTFVSKTIAGFIHRRRDLAAQEAQAVKNLNDTLQPGAVQDPETKQVTPVNVRRYYDLDKKDNRLSELNAEPHLIDAALEIANATTEVIFK